ncbi:hypothetical protein [Paenibacillus sp. Soil522]|nr:hypothetical protein [Paenibacillus sp. Soil522]
MKLRLMLYLNKMAEVLEAATIVVSGKAPSFAKRRRLACRLFLFFA